MAWLILVVAGLCEVGWAVCLRYTKGFTEPWPTAAFGAFMCVSVYLLGVALKSLPLGTAYAVWTGVGAIGTAIVGMLYLGESTEPRRLLCIGLIIAGIVGLKLVNPR